MTAADVIMRFLETLSRIDLSIEGLVLILALSLGVHIWLSLRTKKSGRIR